MYCRENGNATRGAVELRAGMPNEINTIQNAWNVICHPYSSWERGSNEHVNGMIRRKHPKGTDFSKVSKEQLAATEKWINEYPQIGRAHV